MSVRTPRAHVVSSFTIIKGALIDETYEAFQHWDFDVSKLENLRRLERGETVQAKSANWLRDVRKVLNRRFDPAGGDRPLVILAQGGCDRETWKPLLLWHMTRDEFLLRDFITGWLYGHYLDGTFRLRPQDLAAYLDSLKQDSKIEGASDWQTTTRDRVASGLLAMTADFGILSGGAVKEFAPYHLPDDSFMYLLYAISAHEPNAQRVVSSRDWRLFLMDAQDVERELFRQHQFRRLGYESAGTLARLDLPRKSLDDFARELVA